MALVDELTKLEQVMSNKLPDGHTVQELVTLTGKSEEWVRAKLRLLQQSGRLVVGRKRTHRIDGVPTSVAAYKIASLKATR